MNSVDKYQTILSEVPEYLRYKTQKLKENKPDKFCGYNSAENKLKTLFSFATQHLYRPLLKIIPNFNDKKIVVTGSIRNDGVGDYYHVINTAEQLKKAYPEIKIDVIPVFYQYPFPSVKILDLSKFETLLCSDSDIPEQALEKIKDADLILEVSQVILEENYKTLIKEKPEEKYEFIWEYGYTTNSMGIKETDLGIAIKEKPPSHSLLDLENMTLKQFLFITAHPSKQDLENYIKNHELFTAYLKAGSYYQMGLIYTIAALQDNSNKTVDICIPDVDLILLDREHLKKHGIGKISVIKIKKFEGDVVTNELKLSEEGKELRLINPYPLSQSDFHTLILNGNPLVGCTGDHSLSEVVSFNRLPFYEVREMKRNFWGGG